MAQLELRPQDWKKLHISLAFPHPARPWVGGQAALRYLWVLETADVRVQIELDACACTGQRQSTDQQHQEHSERESGCEVDNLWGWAGESNSGVPVASTTAVELKHPLQGQGSGTEACCLILCVLLSLSGPQLPSLELVHNTSHLPHRCTENQ